MRTTLQPPSRFSPSYGVAAARAASALTETAPPALPVATRAETVLESSQEILPAENSAGMIAWMGERHDEDEGRAPICPYCGVTALPAETSNVIDSGFVCDNAECEAYGEPVES